MSTPRPVCLIEYALLSGVLTVRPARITDGDRFKIDARDPAHTRVWVQADLPQAQAGEVREAIATQLAAILRDRRRRELVPVDELESDETPQDELAETGTSSEITARARRMTFGLVPPS